MMKKKITIIIIVVAIVFAIGGTFLLYVLNKDKVSYNSLLTSGNQDYSFDISYLNDNTNWAYHGEYSYQDNKVTLTSDTDIVQYYSTNFYTQVMSELSHSKYTNNQATDSFDQNTQDFLSSLNITLNENMSCTADIEEGSLYEIDCTKDTDYFQITFLIDK